MNRGSTSGHGHGRAVAIRFNEAPIHESGKYGTPRCASAIPTCFNEAPIHESGKSYAPNDTMSRHIRLQ